jgi:hypothetical protein
LLDDAGVGTIPGTDEAKSQDASARSETPPSCVGRRYEERLGAVLEILARDA